jgi:2-keto-4-pentenoate hydratase
MQKPLTPDSALEDTLIAARRAGTRVSAQDLTAPADLEAAMAAQARIFRAITSDVKGWKLGLRPEQLAVSGPMFPILESSNDKVPAMPWRPGMAIEVEVAVRLGEDLPRGAWSREDIKRAVASVHAGIEVIDSRLVEGGQSPFLIFLAEAMGNGGYVVGPGIADRLADQFDGLTITIRADGEQIYSGSAVHPTKDPLLPLLAYARAPNDVLGGLKAGQIVTTGALCGVVAVPRPARIEVLFGEETRLSLDLTA